MSTCRCGHGRHWHKVSLAAAQRRRRRGSKPTGHLPCQYPTGRAGRHGTTSCGCRHYTPATTEA